MGAAIRGDAGFLGILGLGRATRALAGPTISADASQTGPHLVDSFDCLCHGGSGALRSERRTRGAAQPTCKLSAAWAVRFSLELQVLQWAAFVPAVICVCPRDRLYPRFARANGAAANRDRAAQRTTLEGATRCAAVKHGIAKRVHGGSIRISAFRSNVRLTLSVYNDGPKLPPDWEKTNSGIGISNVRTRLQGLYGDRFELTMRNQEPGGVEVSVSVPFVLTASKE